MPGLAPSTPASYEPSVLTTSPFSYSLVSSPKYHAVPSSSLGKPAVGPFDEHVAFPFLVIDQDALHAHDLPGVVGNGHLAALCAPLV
jgi:hypothetical protein